MVKRLSAGLCTILISCVRFYQYFVSPLFPPACRFYPTCSAYAVEAIQRHGALLGSFYAVRRILRCHPWSSGGVDPVPPVRNNDTPYRSR